jgi:hypothetical protein
MTAFLIGEPTMVSHAPTSRRSISFTLIAAVLAAALTACGSNKDPEKDPAMQPTAATIGGKPSTAFAAGTGAQPPPPPAAAGPNGRSAVPTTDEWNAAKEVGVKGSTKLNCETKMVREWLRVSCRGKNDTGGEAKNVTIKKGGGRGDTFTFAANKVTSLICPFVDGTDLVAEFEWTDKKQELIVSWPHGAPMPPLKGEFR